MAVSLCYCCHVPCSMSSGALVCEVQAQKAQKGVWERVYTEDGVELKMESPAKYKQRVRDKQNKSKSRSKKSRLVATKGL